MTSSTHKLLKAIAVVAASAGFAVPAAAATTPHAFQRAVNIHNQAAYPDAFGRAVNIHDAAQSVAAGAGSSQVARSLGTPDTRDAARSVLADGASSEVARSVGTPEARDAAQVARIPSVTIVQSGGFDWADAGIGAGSGIGLLLLLGATGSVLFRQRQH